MTYRTLFRKSILPQINKDKLGKLICITSHRLQLLVQGNGTFSQIFKVLIFFHQHLTMKVYMINCNNWKLKNFNYLRKQKTLKYQNLVVKRCQPLLNSCCAQIINVRRLKTSFRKWFKRKQIVKKGLLKKWKTESTQIHNGTICTRDFLWWTKFRLSKQI